MKLQSIFCLSVMAVTSIQGWCAGGTVGNGGDSAMCMPVNGSPYVGYHSADFLLSLREDNSDLAHFSTWPEYRDRLLRVLQLKYPDFAKLYVDFLARVPGGEVIPDDNIYIHQRMWLEAPYGLIDINDEQTIRKLPPNCRQAQDGGPGAHLIQTVIRQKNGDALIYNYDPSLLRELKKNPLQYSFIVVHEWLWDFIDDPEIIRRVNRFLHSNMMDQLPADELRLTLENLGLTLKIRQFVPVCARTPSIRDILERTTSQPCTEMQTIANAARLGQTGFQNAGLTTLRPGDLSGMGPITQLSLASNQISYLFEDLFFGIFQLTDLDLSNNQIRKFPGAIVKGLPDLKVLNLGKNQLQSFKLEGASPHLVAVYLNDNQIEEIPAGLLKSLPNLYILSLRNNRIKSLPGSADLRAMFSITSHAVDLSGNQIESLPEGIFPVMTDIDLRNEGRPTNGLNVSNNRIRQLPTPPSSMPALNRFQTISLKGNQISTLPEAWVRSVCDFKFNSGIRSLTVDLRDNPLKLTRQQVLELEKICFQSNYNPSGIRIQVDAPY